MQKNTAARSKNKQNLLLSAINSKKKRKQNLKILQNIVKTQKKGMKISLKLLQEDNKKKFLLFVHYSHIKIKNQIKKFKPTNKMNSTLRRLSRK